MQEQILQARIRADVLEGRLEALAITRRTVAELLDAESATDGSGDSDQESLLAGESPELPARTPAKKAGPRVGPRQARPLGPVSRKIVILLVSADRPLRAREVTIALGRKNPSRTQVQGIRRACNKLVASGHLLVLNTGEYAGPAGAA
ncbi:hypothetical protein NLX86_20505 [Streptomyces sp. A3M-1-3]|uniref:hypothetical protein n=1 Tax=Streptomyces sp. A3M-1-3 TaxID=2962044 RepID=UPI0020B74387|nr:hypothetical protein [Streptomyces sp. A3M-1-3]MCP3820390.1 hypothetical protein [Streptomyces sp. A3M-1-3]